MITVDGKAMRTMDQTRWKRAAALGAVTAVALMTSVGVGAMPAVAAGTKPAPTAGRATSTNAVPGEATKSAPAKAAPAKPAKAAPAKDAGKIRVLGRNGYATHLRAAFAETPIRDHATSALTLTVERDPNLTPVDLTGIGFVIDLPQYLVVGSSEVDNNCTNATFTPDYGDGQLIASGIELSASQANCTLSVLVTSPRSGTYTISDAAVAETTGNIGADITPGDLVVTTAPARLSVHFDDHEISVNQTTDLKFSLHRSDENPVAVTSGITWQLTLPTGLVVSSVGANTCGGTATGTVNTRVYKFSGGTIGAGESYCAAALSVRGTAGGVFKLQAGSVTNAKKIEVAFGACLASVSDGDEPDGGADAICTPTLEVQRLKQTVTFAQPAPRKVGDSALVATASSGLPVGFTSSTTAVCTVVAGNTLRVTKEGECTITATQAGNALYAAAHSEARTIAILPRPPAPPAVSGVGGESSITVSWTAPAETEAIVDYMAMARSGDLVTSCTSSTLTCVVGAVAGRSYTLMVVSRGPNGTSTVTSGKLTEPVTAPAVPAAPPQTNLDLTTTDGRISTAAPGQRITFVGTGFAPFSTVVITIYSKPTVLGTVVTDAKGDFSKPITVPPNLAAGAHTAVAQGVAPDGTSRAMALDIRVTEGLPVTGPAVATLLLMGGATVAAGAGLLVAARPRRRPAA